MHRQRTLRALLVWALSPFAPGVVPAGPVHRNHRVPPQYSGEAQKLADPNYGPVPGKSELYNTYYGIERPFPGNIRDPIFPTQDGPPDEDDYVWQNLLSAEWIIFEFYQAGVEKFTNEDFVKIGMPNNTLQRLMEIRNNEAGHLRIFQNMISPTSIKPGPCTYKFPLADPMAYLAFLTVVEISSQAFLTGLVQQPKKNFHKGALAAISQTEARHEKTDPFGGPSDTTFPYANQILYSTHNLIVPNSCPPENPVYPNPRQLLPALSAGPDTKSLAPGFTVTLAFPEPDNQPVFYPGKQYYAVFFHGLVNTSVPLNTTGFPHRPIRVTVPSDFETRGCIVALVANKPGAPTKESVVAGPAVMLEQPWELGAGLAGGGQKSN
ncbi:hypothetical protein VTI74DRAFT_11632 [Chaetomium olivicolor]